MEFNNVTVSAKANVYFDGKVTSRTIITAEGKKKTLGVMLPGEYNFNAQVPERIDITQGRCRVKVPGKEIWTEYKAGQSFIIPANSNFEIKIDELLDYVCNYE
ncbi:MAG TPA: pyrimidine/purine nucleoside phosphorylase [Gammaproteobacteria bacterium]|nr:pyrimidine/purine nucleoside phosphorylase [Gammaproteobacteria bacterium]